MTPPIYITGMGIISALGTGCDATLRALRSDRSGIGPMRHLPSIHRHLPVGEVALTDRQMADALGIAPAMPFTRSALMGLMAAREALAGAGIDAAAQIPIAFVSGSTVGGMERSEAYYLDFLESDRHSEYIGLHDIGATTTLMAHHLPGVTYTASVSTACSSAANALVHAARLIEAGVADVVLAGGTECLTLFHLNGFHTLLILDEQPSRPFAVSRAGLNLGEGAAYLVVESEASMQRRGRQPIARLSGCGNACDAYHQTATSPTGEGPFRAMQAALAEAGLKPSDIDYINAHGTGTPDNDRAEFAAIERLFGTDALPPFSSTKPFTGHTTSASGSIESVICLLAMQHGFIPANLNMDVPLAPGCHPVTIRREGVSLRHVMCNAFGFGGNDTALVFSKA